MATSDRASDKPSDPKSDQPCEDMTGCYPCRLQCEKRVTYKPIVTDDYGLRFTPDADGGGQLEWSELQVVHRRGFRPTKKLVRFRIVKRPYSDGGKK